MSASCVQVVTETSHKDQLRHFLDSQQYTTNSILRYERIFGAGFVSTGGLETTQVCLAIACFSDLVTNLVKITSVCISYMESHSKVWSLPKTIIIVAGFCNNFVRVSARPMASWLHPARILYSPHLSILFKCSKLPVAGLLGSETLRPLHLLVQHTSDVQHTSEILLGRLETINEPVACIVAGPTEKRITLITKFALLLQQFLEMLNLKEGERVLDVGCGIGGGDFYMAEKYGVYVHGVDLSVNMILLAMERASEMKKTKVTLEALLQICSHTKTDLRNLNAHKCCIPELQTISPVS